MVNDTQEFLELYDSLDGVSQVILYAAMKANVDGSLTIDEAVDRMTDQMDRHQRGEPVYLSELGIA